MSSNIKSLKMSEIIKKYEKDASLIKLENKNNILIKINNLVNTLDTNIIIKTDILDYDLINYIWINFIAKEFNLKDNYNNYFKIAKFGSLETDNSCIIENIFNFHIQTFKDDLIMVYHHNSNEINYYLKSFDIINYNKVSLPFFHISLPIFDNDIFNDFNSILNPGECFICFSKS